MLGEFVAEILVKPLLEIILGGAAYYTGAMVLSILTMGALPLAPLDSWGEKDRGKERWYHWALWRSGPGRRNELKAEWVCLVGFLVWIAVGVSIYVCSGNSRDETDAPEPARMDDSSG